MISCPMVLAMSGAFLLAGQAAAQGSAPPPAGPQQSPFKLPSDDIGDKDRISDIARDEQLSKAREGAARQSTRKKSRAVPAKPADIVAGSQVRDSSGEIVGTVETVDGDGAVVASSGGRVVVPLDAFGKNRDGLLLEVTKTEFDALVSGAAGTPAG